MTNLRVRYNNKTLHEILLMNWAVFLEEYLYIIAITEALIYMSNSDFFVV